MTIIFYSEVTGSARSSAARSPDERRKHGLACDTDHAEGVVGHARCKQVPRRPVLSARPLLREECVRATQKHLPFPSKTPQKRLFFPPATRRPGEVESLQLGGSGLRGKYCGLLFVSSSLFING